MKWFSGNYIELEVTLEDANTGYHSGACDNDIAWLLEQRPYIKEQLDKLDPDKLRLELNEFGAWDEQELADHDANLSRILWLACADIVDRQSEEDPT